MNKTLDVLAFTFGEEPLSALRVRAPLMALFEAGEIASFCVIHGDGTLAGPHYPERFNAILVMRDCYPNLSEVLSRHDLPYLYDLDDLLLIKPTYSEGGTAGDIEAIAKGAELISFATPVLARNFKKYSRLDPAAATTVIPNGLFLPPAPRGLEKPSAVVWTSADRSSLSASRNAVCSAISTFCCETGLPLYLFGSVDHRHLARIPEKREFARTDFSTHKLILATHPGLIGAAPLETCGDKATLDFVNSKSDLKMVEFGGYGHNAVYSAAIPYTASTLKTGLIAENSREAWLDALHGCYRHTDADEQINQHAIIRERDIRTVAHRYWLPALKTASMSTPFPLVRFRKDLAAAERTAGDPRPRRGALPPARRQRPPASQGVVRRCSAPPPIADLEWPSISIDPSAMSLHAGPPSGPSELTRLTYALEPEWDGPGCLSLPAALHDRFMRLVVYFRLRSSGRLVAADCSECRESGEWVEFPLVPPVESGIWELHLAYAQLVDLPPTLRISRIRPGNEGAPVATGPLPPVDEWVSLFTRYRTAGNTVGRFAIIVRGGGPGLIGTFHSILNQTHDAWSVYCPDSPPITLPTTREKVRWHAPPGLQDLEEDYFCVLQAGDHLQRDALSIFADHFARFDYAMLYADHVEPDASGRRLVCKTAPDLDQMLTRDCIGRPAVFRTLDAQRHSAPGRLEDEGFPHTQVLVLSHRVAYGRLGQIPLMLCDLTADEVRDPELNHRICRDFVATPGQGIKTSLQGRRVRLRYPIPDPVPEVNILIPTRNRRELLEDCIDSIRAGTDYPAYQIRVLDNDSDDPATLAYLAQLERMDNIDVLAAPGPFNFSAIMNQGVRQTTSPLVVFLNNDTEVIDHGWLRELVSHTIRSEVGVVGARLLYPDNSLQHGGIAIGIHGACGHVYRHLRDADSRVERPPDTLRNVSAVTAACMAVRRDLFEAVGGFDEERFPVSFNDLDLCLRIGERGYRIVYTPWATLYHYESASIGVENNIKDPRFKDELERFRERWRQVLDCDPYFSPNLSLESEQYLPAFPPRTEPPVDPRTRIAEDWIDGVGIEIGALHAPLKVPSKATVLYLDRIDLEALRQHYPELAKQPFARPSIIDNGEMLASIADEVLDFVIANHFLEHAQDPIGTMLNFHRVLKPGGILYLAIPDATSTFDRHRPLTDWDHLEFDHRNGPEASQPAHYREWAELVLDLEGQAAAERAEALMKMSYSIHFHVWTFETFSRFLTRLFSEYLPDTTVDYSTRNGIEGIFVCRKSM